jgi:lysine-specific permease
MSTEVNAQAHPVTEQKSELKRGIGQRQMSMIAIGGAIGTGLFLASGSNIANAGPGGALVAYAIIGAVVYFMMTSLGEMSTQLPIPGGFQAFASRFIDPALGTAFGWNYWFSWAITIAAEFVAAAIIMQYWFPNVPGSIWAAVFFVILLALNLLSAKGYAEAEFWFAGIKVVAVILFIIVGLLIIFGALGNHPGLSNWVHTGVNPDTHKTEQAPFVGGFSPILYVFLIAGFSFQGTEGVGLAAAEAKHPEKTVPKAIRSVFWRILIFYIGAIFVIGTLIPWTDPNLLNSGDESAIAIAPFTIVFKEAGLTWASHLVNFVILTSVLSCGNSSIYFSSRMLYAMSLNRQAPKGISKVNKRGVPWVAVLCTAAFGALGTLINLVGINQLYDSLLNISAQTGFVIWFGIAIAHFRFRRAWKAQGRTLDELKYKAKFYPVAPIVAMVLTVIIIFGANWTTFQPQNFSVGNLCINYGFIVLFLAVYFGFKFGRKTKIIPLKECNFEMPEEADPADA